MALALTTALWLASLAKRDASIIDPFWGVGFVLLGWFYWLTGIQPNPRALAMAGLVTVWGLRLGIYLTWRNWGKGEDYRYRAFREQAGGAFWWRSLATVFWLQGGLMWLVSLPLLHVSRAAGPSGWTGWDVIGGLVFAVGLSFEAVGDWQLARFKADPHNRGKLLQDGLWRYTRHPNYFGDALVWWGLFAFAVSTPGFWWTAPSPVVMTLLLRRVSGVTLLERNLAQTKPGYRDYVRRTNAFVPWFPRR